MIPNFSPPYLVPGGAVLLWMNAVVRQRDPHVSVRRLRLVLLISGQK